MSVHRILLEFSQLYYLGMHLDARSEVGLDGREKWFLDSLLSFEKSKWTGERRAALCLGGTGCGLGSG